MSIRYEVLKISITNVYYAISLYNAAAKIKDINAIKPAMERAPRPNFSRSRLRPRRVAFSSEGRISATTTAISPSFNPHARQ